MVVAGVVHFSAPSFRFGLAGDRDRLEAMIGPIVDHQLVAAALAAPVLQHLEARIDRRTGAATPSLPVFQCLTGPRGGMPRTSRSISGVAGPAGFSQ